MAFPRALRLVRDTATASAVATSMAEAVPDPVHVRESSAIMDAIARDHGGRVARSTALKVPAFTKALKTYTHVIGSFPLREFAGADEVAPRSILNRPDPRTTYWSTMTRTVADLLCEDVAWWRVTARSWDGYPTDAARMAPEEVVEQGDSVYWLSQELSWRNVIRFDGDGLGGWLRNGSTAITAAASLEAAAMRYAEFPLPTIILQNTGADLPPEQVDALLDAWEEARLNRSTAYLNSTLQTHEMGWSAADLQLVDSRNAAAIQIARLANLDPIWTGAGVPGSSLTYSNRVDLYRQLLDTALTPIMTAISQRLSAEDVTPRGHTVRFDTSVFLKANPQDISTLITQQQPLGNLTPAEARALLDLPANGATP